MLPISQRGFMGIKKLIPEREKELRCLLQSSDGEAKLPELASTYAADGGHDFWSGGSVITYIIVYEQIHGLIAV
jgi:hypothetical protein